MEILDKVTNWLWLAIVAIIGAIWAEVRGMKRDLAKTRENMSTRAEHLALAAIVANTRETRMTREEMMLAIKDFKADTDARLDRIAAKLESTEEKLTDSEQRTSDFRHDMRTEVSALSLNVQLMAQRSGVDMPARDRR